MEKLCNKQKIMGKNDQQYDGRENKSCNGYRRKLILKITKLEIFSQECQETMLT